MTVPADLYARAILANAWDTHTSRPHALAAQRTVSGDEGAAEDRERVDHLLGGEGVPPVGTLDIHYRHEFRAHIRREVRVCCADIARGDTPHVTPAVPTLHPAVGTCGRASGSSQ